MRYLTYADFQYLTVDVDDSVATVTMLRPEGSDYEVVGAHPMHTELRDIFTPLSADDKVAAVVLTGTGETFFAGPDLEHMRDMLLSGLSTGVQQMLEARQIIHRMLDFDKPLVAAVNGTALGSGYVMAFLCDFIVASKTAKFQDTHVRLGLPAGDGGTMLWPLLVGLSKARALLLRGHPLTAAGAYELGLVAELVEEDQTIPTAVALAQRLRDLPQFAYRATKLGLNQWFRMASLFSLDLSLGLQVASFSGPEFSAAVERAIEKRDAAAL